MTEAKIAAIVTMVVGGILVLLAWGFGEACQSLTFC